jgi:hypothetical protein
MAKRSKSSCPPPSWQLFAWQGIRVRVPPDWNPASLSGSGEEGYLRLDGPDQPRLEIKWAQARGFVEVSQIVERYLRSMGRGRSGQAVKVDARARLELPMPKERSSVQFFHWQGEQQAWGAAWFCRSCNRTIMAQVLGAPGEELQGLAEQVLSSLADHPAGSWVSWALYGLHCQVPADFRLSGQRLMTGLLELQFERGRSKLRIARWGLADVALARSALAPWLREKNRKAWRNFVVDLTPTEIHGHTGLAIAGASAVPFVRLAALTARLLGRPYPDALRGAAWVCPTENKIFHLEAVLDPSEEAMLAEVLERLLCHRSGGDTGAH